jgi:anti-anti-sigma factor
MSTTLDLIENPKNLVLMLEVNNLRHPAVNAFKESLYEALDGKSTSKPCLINFSRVAYMDSFSLAVILSIYKYCREHNRSLALTHLNDQVKKLIQLTRLESILPVYGNDDEATLALIPVPKSSS